MVRAPASATLDSRLFSRQAERIVSAGQSAFDRIFRTFIGARAALGVALVLALAATGLVLILPIQGLDAAQALDPLGIAYALTAGLFWALYIVFGQKVARRYGRDATPMGMLAGALVVAPIALLQSGAALFNADWLLGGLALLALLCVQAVRYSQAWRETAPVPLPEVGPNSPQPKVVSPASTVSAKPS